MTTSDFKRLWETTSQTAGDCKWVPATVSDYKWLQVTTSDCKLLRVTVSDYERLRVRLQVTTSDYERLRAAISGYGWLERKRCSTKSENVKIENYAKEIIIKKHYSTTS